MLRITKLSGAESMKTRAMMAADITVEWKSYTPDANQLAKQAEITKLKMEDLDDSKLMDVKDFGDLGDTASSLGSEPLDAKFEGDILNRLRPSLFFDNDGVVSESDDGKTTVYTPGNKKTLDVLIEYDDGNLSTVVLGKGWTRMVTQDAQGNVRWYAIFNSKGELVVEIVDGTVNFNEDADVTDGGGQVTSTHDGSGYENSGHANRYSEEEVDLPSRTFGDSTSEEDGPISYGSPSEEDTRESQQEQEDDPLVTPWSDGYSDGTDDGSDDAEDVDLDDEEGGDTSGSSMTGITEDPDDPSGDGEGDPEVDGKIRGDGRRDPQDEKPDSSNATLGYVGGSTVSSGRSGSVTNPGEDGDKYGTKPALPAHLIDFVLGDGLFDPKPLF